MAVKSVQKVHKNSTIYVIQNTLNFFLNGNFLNLKIEVLLIICSKFILGQKLKTNNSFKKPF